MNKLHKNLSIQTIDLNSISKNETKNLINILSNDLIRYNKAYYNDNNPLVSDAEYDYIFFTLKSLEEKFPELALEDSPTNKVGFTPAPKFTKVTHKLPMLSLGNGFTNEDILDFIKRVKNFFNIDYFPEFFCEPKIDGLSFNAYYENNILKTGATRGDGHVGENITTNIQNINLFPIQINNAPETLEVRGEIFMDLLDFKELNNQQEKLGLPKFANPRNAAAGSLRQLDANITKSRSLKYFIYAVGDLSKPIAKNQTELLEVLSSYGFAINPIGKLAQNEQDMFLFYEHLREGRHELPYEIDGVVYKLNDFSLQERMGAIARTPRHSIAHKFPAIIGTTKLINIHLQVGRTGAVTPVAEVEPLHLKGVTITKATLHNFQEIERKDIRLGDYIFLQRAGDVIPQITAVNYDKRDTLSQKFIIPTHCPSCNSLLHISDKDILIRCENGLNCQAQIYERLYHFVTKDALNIVGLGKKQIKMLLERNLISNPVDIFNLHNHKNLENFERLGEKSVSNLLTNIDTAKKVQLNKFIFSLGIRHVGQEAAKLIAKEFIDIDNFISAVKLLINDNKEIYTKLDDINGIGEKVVKSLKDFFSIQDNLKIVEELSKILEIQNFIAITKVNSIINNQIVVFTGNLKTLSRSEAKISAEKLGAKVTSAISNQTNILVAGENAGSKLKKAKELGIQIIYEDDWINYIK